MTLAQQFWLPKYASTGTATDSYSTKDVADIPVMASKCRHAVGTTNQLAPHQDGPSLKLMRPSLKSCKTVLKEKFTLHSRGNMISVSTQAKA